MKDFASRLRRAWGAFSLAAAALAVCEEAPAAHPDAVSAAFAVVRRFGPADPPSIVPAVDNAASHEVALASHRRGFYGPYRTYSYLYRPWYTYGYSYRTYAYRPWYRLYSPGWFGAAPAGPVVYPSWYGSGVRWGGYGVWGYYPRTLAVPVWPGPSVVVWPYDGGVGDCYYW